MMTEQIDRNVMRDINWPSSELLPVIVQHAISGKVLMQAYMNQKALEITLECGQVTFYSRSKQRLWKKGETSGHFLNLVSMACDCDGDSLLVLALPQGPTCHTGRETCWTRNQQQDPSYSFLYDLEKIIHSRKSADPSKSYTARLFCEGKNRMAQKVGEEGVEVALAAVGDDKSELTLEAADLLFHLMVLLQSQDIELHEVIQVLYKRHRGVG